MSKNTKVVLFKGGTKECTVKAQDIQIPDLWHIAQAIRRAKGDFDGDTCAEHILNCWHICGALRQHILEN